jgi:hypothetical protein
VVWWRFWGFFCFFLCVFGRLASSPCGLGEFSVVYVGGVWEFGLVFFVHGVNMGMIVYGINKQSLLDRDRDRDGAWFGSVRAC